MKKEMNKVLALLLLLSCYALPKTVFSETDKDALRAINDIRKGKPNANAIEDLYVTDDGTIRDDLTVIGDGIVGGTMVVSGRITAAGSTIAGSTTNNGAFTVNGNATITGNAVVSGAITGASLNVSGLASFQNVDINAQFNANGATTLGNDSADRVAVNGNIAFIPSVVVVTNGQVINLTGPYVELSNTDIPSCTNTFAAVQPSMVNFIINVYNRGTNDIVITEAAPFTCVGTSLTIGPKDCFSLIVRNTNDLVQSVPVTNN